MGVFAGYFKDPCFEKDGQWFFWDKSWSYIIGPFLDEKTAREELDIYSYRSRGADKEFFVG